MQNSFAQFEAHVLQTIQHGLDQFNQIVGKQADQTKLMVSDSDFNPCVNSCLPGINFLRCNILMSCHDRYRFISGMLKE